MDAHQQRGSTELAAYPARIAAVDLALARARLIVEWIRSSFVGCDDSVCLIAPLAGCADPA